jgi:hypothetical protein
VTLSCILLTNREHVLHFLSRHPTPHLRLVINKFPNIVRSGKPKGQWAYCVTVLCEIWGFHSGVAEDSTLLGCDTVVRSVIPMFWRIKNAFIFNVRHLHPDIEVTTILQNIGNYWSNDTTSHPRWLECSTCCVLHVLLKLGYSKNFRVEDRYYLGCMLQTRFVHTNKLTARHITLQTFFQG